MFKFTFIVAVMILDTKVVLSYNVFKRYSYINNDCTIVCAKNYRNVDCNACGEECKRACGTKQFKACCYNYLRKKRAPETIMVLSPIESMRRANLPIYSDNMAQDVVDAVDQYRYYPSEDSFDMRPINDF